jgi:hypothetical protein
MRKLLKMLEQRGISEDEAIKYIESSIPYKRTWKMWKFTLYLWMRVYYDKKGITKSRIDVVKEMVNSGKYERLYATFPLPLPMDKEKEIKNLTQLIAEPRQTKEFKSKNFVYEGTKKNIPQSVIDRLR